MRNKTHKIYKNKNKSKTNKKSNHNKNNNHNKKSNHNKNNKKKTCKKTFLHKKQKFVKELLNEWKKQTHGCIEKDKRDNYVNDYYLSFNKICDVNNHIHLVLKDFKNTCNYHNNIIYLFKKYDQNTSRIIHSHTTHISMFNEPKIVVDNMVHLFLQFLNS
jgi:hypothetical protein